MKEAEVSPIAFMEEAPKAFAVAVSATVVAETANKD
jgi:hypothetical protein